MDSRWLRELRVVLSPLVVDRNNQTASAFKGIEERLVRGVRVRLPLGHRRRAAFIASIQQILVLPAKNAEILLFHAELGKTENFTRVIFAITVA
jgi:hypothetical protein